MVFGLFTSYKDSTINTEIQARARAGNLELPEQTLAANPDAIQGSSPEAMKAYIATGVLENTSLDSEGVFQVENRGSMSEDELITHLGAIENNLSKAHNIELANKQAAIYTNEKAITAIINLSRNSDSTRIKDKANSLLEQLLDLSQKKDRKGRLKGFAYVSEVLKNQNQAKRYEAIADFVGSLSNKQGNLEENLRNQLELITENFSGEVGKAVKTAFQEDIVDYLSNPAKLLMDLESPIVDNAQIRQRLHCTIRDVFMSKVPPYLQKNKTVQIAADLLAALQGSESLADAKNRFSNHILEISTQIITIGEEISDLDDQRAEIRNSLRSGNQASVCLNFMTLDQKRTYATNIMGLADVDSLNEANLNTEISTYMETNGISRILVTATNENFKAANYAITNKEGEREEANKKFESGLVALEKAFEKLELKGTEGNPVPGVKNLFFRRAFGKNDDLDGNEESFFSVIFDQDSIKQLDGIEKFDDDTINSLSGFARIIAIKIRDDINARKSKANQAVQELSNRETEKETLNQQVESIIGNIFSTESVKYALSCQKLHGVLNTLSDTGNTSTGDLMRNVENRSRNLTKLEKLLEDAKNRSVEFAAVLGSIAPQDTFPTIVNDESLRNKLLSHTDRHTADSIQELVESEQRYAQADRTEFINAIAFEMEYQTGAGQAPLARLNQLLAGNGFATIDPATTPNPEALRNLSTRSISLDRRIEQLEQIQEAGDSVELMSIPGEELEPLKQNLTGLYKAQVGARFNAMFNSLKPSSADVQPLISDLEEQSRLFVAEQDPSSLERIVTMLIEKIMNTVRSFMESK